MRLVIQRVSRASVVIDDAVSARIGHGLVVLVGVDTLDTDHDADQAARRVAALRIFSDAAGRMNHSLIDAGGEALVVPQFTLLADTTRGHRPSFARAAPAAQAEPLYRRFCAELAGAGVPVMSGVFGASMQVELVNDGPVTIIL